MNDEKECFLCSKEAMLALFGVGLGLLFIVMSLDTLRRMRIEAGQPIGTRLFEGEISE